MKVWLVVTPFDEPYYGGTNAVLEFKAYPSHKECHVDLYGSFQCEMDLEDAFASCGGTLSAGVDTHRMKKGSEREAREAWLKAFYEECRVLQDKSRIRWLLENPAMVNKNKALTAELQSFKEQNASLVEEVRNEFKWNKK